jgi:hypothetical protein
MHLYTNQYHIQTFVEGLNIQHDYVQKYESHTQLDFVGPSVSLQAVSRPIELSLQSSLQLSLTVLVCYRSHSNI